MSRKPGKLQQLREQAISLCQAGRSRSQIKGTLGVVDNGVLTEWLRGVPPPEWTRRPSAKDELRAQARELRKQGLRYKDIAAQLHVSMSSVSLWVRDLPTPPRIAPAKSEEGKKRSAEGLHRYQAERRKLQAAQRSLDVATAAAEVGSLTDRELLIAGAIAYWCEGEKAKPYRRTYEDVNFINSDPGLILLFLHFLDSTGVSRSQMSFRVHIHETADVAAATRYWCDLADVPPWQFIKPNIKRHNPRTIRKNSGANYHGCLQIRVLNSAALYRKIEGWASGTMSARVS